MAPQAESIVEVTEAARGTPGLSAYNVAVAHGFIGTELAWLASLHGAPGPGTDVVTPEQFASAKISGVVGDGTDDGPAFAAMCAAINAAGGAVLQFSELGDYVFAPGQVYQPVPAEVIYNYPPLYKFPFELHGLTKPLIIRGNGARVRCLAGGLIGVFNPDRTVNPTGDGYLSTGVGVPYNYMLYIHDCTGPVRVENLDLNGNIAGQTIGGRWGDQGWQLPNTGLVIENCTGGVDIDGVLSHHHGLDGIMVNGAATSDSSPSERGFISNSEFSYNGRNGYSKVGGRGWAVKNCKFNWNANTTVTGSTISSPPCAGVDLEAEGGKFNRDDSFRDCESTGNRFQQLVAASGPTSHVDFENCNFVATVAGSNTVVPAKPFIRFKGCLMAGTAVSFWRNAANPAENVVSEDCRYSNSDEFSPTGATATTNNLVIDVPEMRGVPFNHCTFDFNKPGVSINFSIDHPLLNNCTVVARNGYPAVNGRFSGKTEFIETGAASIQTTPGGGVPGPFPFKGNAGHAEDVWAYTTGGVRTEYPATISKATNDVLGVATNAADADAVLTPGTDRQSQRFTAALTADRAVTLSAVGAKSGSRFKISRTGGGAFNLNVGVGPLKALATNTWAEFEYDIAAAAWRLTSAGNL